MCLTRVRGTITQQDHLIPQFPVSLFAQTQMDTYKGLFQYSSHYCTSDKTIAVGPGGKDGHARKSLWGSIRQFSVRSVADTGHLLLRGRRIGSGGLLVEISPCLSYLSLNTLIMTNSFCNVPEQSRYTPPPCFHSVSHLLYPS